jgi:hypothetical protein
VNRRLIAIGAGLAGLAAIVVGVIVIAGGGDDADSAAAKQAAARECSRQQAAPLTRPPSGAHYSPLTGAQRAGLAQAFGGSGIPSGLVDGRRVTITTGQGTGVLVVNKTPDLVTVPGPGENDALLDEFETAFRNAAEAQRLELTETEIEGERVLIAGRRGLANVIGTAGCYGFAAFATRRAEAQAIAEAVIAEGKS